MYLPLPLLEDDVHPDIFFLRVRLLTNIIPQDNSTLWYCSEQIDHAWLLWSDMVISQILQGIFTNAYSVNMWKTLELDTFVTIYNEHTRNIKGQSTL